MTKQELEKAIKNGKSVWAIYKDQSSAYEIKSNNIEKVFNDTFLWGREYYCNIKDAYKTQAEAEHYLHHANVSRIEHLPFLTWEEFKEQKQFTFIGRSSLLYRMRIEQFDDKYLIFLEHYFMESFNVSRVWDLTEANFYKAYDECVRLFKGEE